MEDEDYWNSSKTTGFSFDDDEVAPVSSLFSHVGSIQSNRNLDVRNAISGAVFSDFVELKGVRPIESLLSKRSLSLVLGHDVKKKEIKDSSEELSLLKKQVASYSEPPPVSTTVRSIIMGRPFSFHLYRSLEYKLALLDEAVKTGDGNAILAVTLFLQNTLKRKLFWNSIQTHMLAINVYVNYLSTRYETKAVVELFQMLGRPRDAAMRDFQLSIQPQQDVEKRLSILKSLLRDHYSISDVEDKLFVDNFKNYTEWQVTSAKKFSPLLGTVFTSLTYLCSHHYDELMGQPLSPLTLNDLLRISERVYHWAALLSLAGSEKWEKISGLLLTKSWLGGKKLKTVLTAEKIVIELHNRQAPEPIIQEYFALIDNYEKQLDLSRKLAWHKAVIDTLVAMKDRQGIMQYQAALNSQSHHYIYAETSLRSNKKWKN